MLVSVIIPAYNAGKFIRETLHSVLHQTHLDLEIIVVDDGSTDDTVAIVKEIQSIDPRITLHHQVNQGASVARNSGILLSKADFIAFLDADDLWLSTKIEKQLGLLLSSSEDVGLVYCFSKMIDAEGYLQGDTGACVLRRGQVFLDLLVYNFIGNGSVAMVRRSCLPVGHFDPDQKGNEDTYFYLRMAAISKIEVVPEFLVGYRWNTGQNKSGNLDRQINSYKSMMEKVRKLYPDIPIKIINWGRSSFYLSHAQTLFKKKLYIKSLVYFLTEVLANPSYVFSPPFRRLCYLSLKWFPRRILHLRSERKLFLDTRV